VLGPRRRRALGLTGFRRGGPERRRDRPALLAGLPSKSETWPEIEQRVVQWANKALALIKDPELKGLIAAFAKRIAVAASKSTP
jgi:hypothetical protein